MSNKLCDNCNDGCIASLYCEGCEMDICTGCFGEHNQDMPCHVCGAYPARDADGNLTEEGCQC